MNALYDYCFWSLMILSIGCSIKLWTNKTSSNNLGFKIGKFICFLTAGLLVLWQLALWTIPKGNRIGEGIRIPRHFWHLENEHIIPTPPSQKISYGTHEKQYLMYYPAPKGSTKQAVIFYWHGGGWHTGNPHQHRHLAGLLHQQGYSVIMPAYRLGPIYGYEEIKEDIDKAFVFGNELLQKKGLGEYPIIIGGTSAGSNISALLVFDEERWLQLGIDRSKLLGYFGLVSVLDLDLMGDSQVLNNYAGSKEAPSYFKANPINF
ncbi:MAG: alpha/beta hydrolase, partial [Saprospiraceae bacterium]|nr:alpha/beta hydrolase [Saprospiraceae bacterium]